MTNNITLAQIEAIRDAFRQWAFAVTDVSPMKPGGAALTDAHLDALDAAVSAVEDGSASPYALGTLIGYLGHLAGCTPPGPSGVMGVHHDLSGEPSPVAQAVARLQAAVLAAMPPVVA